MPGFSLMGPNDLQLWIDGGLECGKDYSRGFFVTGTGGTIHTFEDPLELWKYTWKDTDGVAGSNLLNAGGAILDPGRYDTSLQNRKQMPKKLPFTVTHHSVLVERRSAHDATTGDDLILNVPNVLIAEARIWYELYFDEDEAPCAQGLLTEFPPGFGPEMDSTDEATEIIRTGMNNMSVVQMLPRIRQVTKQVLSKFYPTHTTCTLTGDGGAGKIAGTINAIGLRNTIYWYRSPSTPLSHPK